MTVQVPRWLNKEYIETALQQEGNYSIKIQDMQVEMAVPKGNNFVCNVYRVSVEYAKSIDDVELHKISLIIKEPIYGPMYESLLKTSIETEVKVYELLAPKMNSIFHAVDGSEEENDVFPKSYFSSEKNVVILEDLKCRGYVMGDRVNRFDFEHCVVALKALAKFHAGSRIAIEQNPYLLEVFTLYLNTVERKAKHFTVYMTNFKNLADEFQKHPHLEKYSGWLYENYKTGLDKGFKLMDPEENEFNVLIHGDFCLQNMLIKYTDSTPTKGLLIDYQCCRYSSPVVDFFFFVEFNIQEDVRYERLDELVDIYVNELNYNLKKYGRTASTLDLNDFKRCMDERLYLRVFLTVAFLALEIGMPDESEAFKFEDLTPDKINESETNPFQIYVRNERFIKVIAKRFEHFKKMGLIKIDG